MEACKVDRVAIFASSVTQVEIDSRTWLVFANLIVSSALGALASCFCYGSRINTRSNAGLYVGLTLSAALA